MTNPLIVQRAKKNYEDSVARKKEHFLENGYPWVEHPSWEKLLVMAATLEGVYWCVNGWYELAKEEMERENK